ncbi:hypothetical protein FS749_003404 [Ceratobasidium sp. UAMH 11750]|nr:hypothetical protein FS749_003404 [Ceratobasidium sp. UAMH 11750]
MAMCGALSVATSSGVTSRTPIPLISKPSIISPTSSFKIQDFGTASAFSTTAMAPSNMPKKPFYLNGHLRILGV